MHICICEDEATHQDALSQSIARWQASAQHHDVVLSCFSSSEDLLGRYAVLPEIDLLFIDIQIPGELNGIELARKIRESNDQLCIVFVTNYCEYVYEGYTVNALRFLQKPFQDPDISFCCNYVYNRLYLKKESSFVFKSRGKHYALNLMEILYIEINSHTISIYTSKQSEPLQAFGRLADIGPRLPSSLFIPCHRSYIVNIAHVRLLTRTYLVLSNHKTLPVSRTSSEQVCRLFEHYHQGGCYAHGSTCI